MTVYLILASALVAALVPGALLRLLAHRESRRGPTGQDRLQGRGPRPGEGPRQGLVGRGRTRE